MRPPAGDRRDQRGATAVEYGVIAALVAGVVGGVVLDLGQHVLALFVSVPGF